ncbi:hypothetical protein OHA70_30830 [Kribbella sp. NBC_00382]|uniref:hypothetical protein n=1 Tax=Kribbella sp. NBC_00382 TaxID=2975967 RepID=UPI002E205A6E
MTRIDELAVLKTLDPAEGDVDLYCPRAIADLERILATDPAVSTTQPWKSRRKRVALGIGLVAAATTAAFVLPSLFGGDQAIANWTAEPAALSADGTAKAAATCRTKMGAADPSFRNGLSTATVAISERRGPWSMVVLTNRAGLNVLCIDDRREPGTRWFMGSIGSGTERPGRRGLEVINFGTATLDGRALSVAVGLAGSDVTGVSYSSPTHGKVKGTVTSGQFALWLPGKDMENAGDVGVALQVTYRDGGTATVKVP